MTERTCTADENLVRRLPLPLGQLYRRAHNAKTPLERHHTAYYIWEAGLKLLGSILIIEYAESGGSIGSGGSDPEMDGRLRNLARPSLGHWWEFARRLLPIIGGKPGNEPFRPVQDFLLGGTRDDLPRAAGLDAALREMLDSSTGARTTVRVGELFDRLLRYRNREFGHGAAGQRPGEFYERMGQAILAGVTEVFTRVDLLLGRRLIYISDVRRQASGNWIIERYELMGETSRRIESLELPQSEMENLPSPDQIYVEVPAGEAGMEVRSSLRSLHPLVFFDPESGEFFFLNARRGKRRSEYLCYQSGQVVDREDLGSEQRELLQSILGRVVNRDLQESWCEKSQAEEPAFKGEDPEPDRRRMGEFELISRIGRGGMGIVYRAWQPSLGRQVALKCLLGGAGDPKIESRFAREIRSLGRVEHPNLVKIFSSGSDGDQWFYAMELIEGVDLSSICEQLSGSTATEVSEIEWRRALSSACREARRKEETVTPGEPRFYLPAEKPFSITEESKKTKAPPGAGHIERIVKLIRQVAEAAHALHEAGIIHRDIKPGNIQLTSDGFHAVLMDLGLAQLADDAEGKLTRTRQFVGTLRYASPEQLLAAGALDRRSDVYSLGATLWELLTLRPLFGAGEETPTPDLMLKIYSTESERPRKFNPLVSPDLEAIVLKCLEKDRTRRYATAADLADDLGRWQRGEPVSAQPPSLRYLLGKYVRRHKAQITLAGILVFVALLGLAASFYRIHQSRREAEIGLFDLYTTMGLKASEEGNKPQAVLWFASAASIPHIDPGREEANRVRLRSWISEVPIPVRAFPHEGRQIREIAFHPGGGFLLVLSSENQCTLWDLETEETIPLPGGDRPIRVAAWNPGGEWFVLGNPEGQVEIYRFPTWEPVVQLTHPGGLQALDFSRDGRFLALASDRVQVWDSRTFNPATPELVHPQLVLRLEFNSRGDRILTTCGDELARIYPVPCDDSEAKSLFKPIRNFLGIYETNFTPFKPSHFIDGDRGILTITGPTEVTWWDAETGQPIHEIHLKKAVAGVAVSPDGRFFLAYGDEISQFWDTATGKPLGLPFEYSSWTDDAVFCSDGSGLITASSDRTARLWTLPAPRPSKRVMALTERPVAMAPHQNPVHRIAYSPDAQFFATAQSDGLVRVWRPGRIHAGEYRDFMNMVATKIVLSPDGLHFMPIRGPLLSPRWESRVYKVATGEPAGPTVEAGGILNGGGLSTDGIHAFNLTIDPASIQVWNWQSGQIVFQRELPANSTDACYSTDGKLLSVHCADGQILLIDSIEGRTKILNQGNRIQKGNSKISGRLLFTPDCKSLITWQWGKTIQTTIKVWEISTANYHDLFKGPPSFDDLSLSTDGQLLMGVFKDHSVAVWNFPTGQPLSPLLQHPDRVSSGSFSPNGRHVLTVCDDRMVRIWDWKAGKLVCPPLEHDTKVQGAEFIPPEGRWILTADSLSLRAWDWRTGMEVIPPRLLASEISQLLVNKEGNYVLTGGISALQIFDLEDLAVSEGRELNLGSLRLYGEILSGQTIHKGGGVANLSSDEWLLRWREFRREHPESFTYDLSSQAILNWHHRRAEELEQGFNWDAASWHLERLGGVTTKADRTIKNRLQEFVRSWRFAKIIEPLNLDSSKFDQDDFVRMDARRLAVIVESAKSSKLYRSPGPFVEFNKPFSGKTSFVTGWALRTIEVDQAMPVKIFTGSDDTLRIWLNGELVLEKPVLRPPSPDMEVTALNLVPGTNTLLVEVSQVVGAWGLYLRFEDLSGRKLKLTDEGRLEPLIDPD